jgi:hypothetical protein
VNQILADTFSRSVTGLGVKLEEADGRNYYANCAMSLKKDFMTVRFADKKFICGLFVKFIVTV